MNIQHEVKNEIVAALPFIQEQVSVQKKLAKKFADQEYRKNLHNTNADKNAGIAVTLEKAISYISELEQEVEVLQQKKASNSSGIQLNLKFEEVADLPEELLKELSLSDTDKVEFQIRELIEELGGIASLDRIIIGIYKKTSEIVKRSTITSRLYRMSQKEVIFGVPGRKGVYSTEELSEEEAEKLIRGESISAK